MLAAGAAGLAAGVGVQLMNNAFADKAARESFGRQRILMNEQNRYNAANVQSEAGREVLGYRGAGLNPALMLANGTQAAPTVSQGNADMAQRFPLSVSDMLAAAQIENIKADTKKKEAEVPNVNADTDLKVSQKLYQDASTEVQKEKAQEIANNNQKYKDQNTFVQDQGPAMMDAYRSKLKEDKIWDKMLPRTRETIDGLADGDLPMSVGALIALKDIIDQEGNMSDTDTKMAKNALANSVVYKQLSNNEILDAMAKQPWYEQELKKKSIEKIEADIEKVRKEVLKIIAEIPKIKSETEYQELVNKSFKSGDLDYLKSQGEYGKWFEKYSEELLMRVFPLMTGGVGVGKGLQLPSKSGGKGRQPSPNIYREGTAPWVENPSHHGVENMKF